MTDTELSPTPAPQPQRPSPYRSPEFLDSMRQQGDPPADRLIDELLTEGKYMAVRGGLQSLQYNDAPPDPGLPGNLQDYLHGTAQLPAWADPELLARSSEFFTRHGPCILMMLGCYALPADYAARKGVQVLHRTGELMGNTTRRVIETAQMAVDVLEHGGLQPGGRGLRSIQKVRLVHAMVRRKLLSSPLRPWDWELGLPINQEDLAGTLLSFSVVVLDGFNKLGAPLPRATAEAFLHTWKVVGWLMGLRPELLPRDLDDAEGLAALIRERQFCASQEGQQLTSELIKMMEYNTPGRLFDGLPNALMHHFLGSQVAAGLGLPPPDWTTKLVQWGQWLGELHLALDSQSLLCARMSERFAHAYVYGLLHTQSDESRPPFMLPAGLQENWRMPLSGYQLA